MKLFLLSAILILGMISFYIITYIKSPIYASTYSLLNGIRYRVMCFSEWEKKVLHVPIFIESFDVQNTDIVFEILKKIDVNIESIEICPSVIKIDSLVKYYRDFNIEIYKNNVVNIDEVAPDYYYKLTKFNVQNYDTSSFTKNCCKLERIK